MLIGREVSFITGAQSSIIATGCAFLFLLTALARADPVLPYVISDHAVLQREHEIRIWGTANPGENVTVTLADKQSSTRAARDGRWSVLLPPMGAGGPFTLRVTGLKTIEVKDLMIGEVWLASGQSSMTFELGNSDGASEEVPRADYPEIRLMTVPKRVSLVAQTNTLPTSWQTCTPKTAVRFSAVGYYFARDLFKKLNVPIGIIESAWPGTTIEEWVPPEAARRDPQIQPMLDAWDHNEGKGYPGGKQAFALEFDDFELMPATGLTAPAVRVSDFASGSARTSWGGSWSYSFDEAPETGFDLSSPGHTGHGYAARVAGNVDASDHPRLQVRFQPNGLVVDLSAY